MRLRLLLAVTLLWTLAVGTTACQPRRSQAGKGGTQGPGALAFRPVRAVPGVRNPKDDKKPTWNVDAPPGPKVDIDIDTDEGTWMSLDIHPKGDRIVFDLLGDLYELPIGGGDAKALTSGISWDMQPRYSPDGRWIAFTSDRDGADNLWVLPAAGGDPVQVSKEDFRLVNSPSWTPDSQFIAVRKHFTAQRSLGAGEIWLFHLSGGKGVQMTEKPNDEKDVGEPAISPDGRYLYYSHDATPGKQFEYNKDPHGGIYVISRLDREEDRTEVFVRRPGGAVRPTPSPDGKRLAYVGREGLRTVLLIQDLDSGAEQIVYRGLERDMQETWAIHGVYPTMAWTPDGKALVFWARGKLHRLALDRGTDEIIPFRVRDKRTIAKALRFPVKVHPDRFHTKMLRWAQVSPDGKTAVFQALGHLYVRAVAGGKPRRLTKDRDVFEFYPRFSRDGKRVVYTTWNDEGLGSVRVVSSRGGRGKTLTEQPGHYVEPAMSPDGGAVVYRRVRGGGLRSKRWGRNPGIYRVSSRGGPSDLVTRSGTDPHFGEHSDRVYYVDQTEKDDKRHALLKSIGLDGAEDRTHLRSEGATEYRVSPDGRWVAFRELYNAYLAPMPRAGRPVEVGPKAEGLPVVRVSRDAGEYLHWSGDSQALHWSLGPELFTRRLEEAFAFVDGAPDELPDPPTKGLDLGFDTDAYRPKGTVAFVGAKVITARGDEVIENAVIVVKRDRIEAIGPASKVAVPPGARTFDVKGKTIIPGLVDVHAHGPQGGDGMTPQANWLHYATLAFGVTTVHDPSNDTATIFAASELSRAGLIVAPRIFSTGTILYGAKTPFTAKVESLDDARGHLRRMKAVGAFSVKSYNQPRRNQRQQLVAAARELEMMVVPEGGSLFQHNMTMVADGHTGIEHAIPVAAVYDDVFDFWGPSGVGYTPTIVVGYGGLWGENYWYAHTNVFEHERLRRFVPRNRIEGRSRRRVLASRGDWNHFRIARTAKALADAGVGVQLGAHGQREGLAAHWELWMFAQGGMTPVQAIRASTIAGARYLGLDGDLGSLEPGKLADFAVLDGDPIAEIRATERVRYTVLGGRVFEAATMSMVSPVERPAPQFYWQRPGG